MANYVAPSPEALRTRPPSRLLSASEESTVLMRLRRRLLLASLRQALKTARFRLALVVALTLFFWAGLFLLLYETFHFLASYIGSQGALHNQVVQFTFDVFFCSLLVMLMFSAGIIFYGALFRSPETIYLLTLPLRPGRVVLYKFQETVLLSSWGFLLLGSPMLVAYGVVTGAPWTYYALLAPMMVAFVYIPCSIGALCCLAIARWLPRFRMSLLGGTAALVVGLAGYAIWSVVAGDRSDLLTERWFHHTLNRLSFTSSYLLPSWWLSSGLLQAARAGSPIDGAGFTQSLWFLALLVSNAMLGQVATHALGSRVLRASYSRLHTGPSGGTHRGGKWIDRITMAVTFPLPHQVRLLILKDLRVFRRDPVQWAQFLIFFGLLGLYFLNIRRVTYDVDHTLWVNMISFLNLAVVGLILSTFTTRFIFPMISLEGSRFWILGLLPIERDTILWGKFLFAAVGAAIPSTVLILISDLMLRVAPLVVVIHQITCLLLCAGLSGLAVGMGALMPNLKEQSPSKIAAGFGGTLNLVLSALYIIIVVALTAVPCHFYLAAQPAGVQLPEELQTRLIRGIWISTGLAVGVGVLATFVPLYRGLRAFRRLQF